MAINTLAPLAEDLCRKLNVTSIVSVLPDPSRRKLAKSIPVMVQYSSLLPILEIWEFFFLSEMKHLSLL